MNHNWTYKKVKEVCDKASSTIVLNKIENNSGDYALYGASGFVKGIDFYHRDKPYIGIVKDGAGVGRVNVYPAKSSLVGTMQYILPKENVQLHYLCYALKGLNLAQLVSGATIPHIYFKDYGEFPIPLPPLETQSRIVAELDLLQSIIDKQKAQLAELDNLAQCIFYDMFGDPVENEKGWEVRKLGEECTDMKYGTSRPSSENGQYPYLRMCNISYDGYLDLNNLKTIDIPKDEIDKCLVKYGDILFNRTNSIELIGKTCMFDLDTPMIIAGYIIRVRLSNKLEPRFISRMFNLPSMKKLLREMAKGAVNQANINSKELASIEIPLPPLSLQQSFAAKIESIEKQKAAIGKSIEETQKLFDYTMDKYFG